MSNETKSELLVLLKQKSVFHGDFTLASGAKSNFYIDCRLTTLDARGAWLVGQVFHSLIRQKEKELGVTIRAVGGLTMGADPIALAVAMVSHWAKDPAPLQAFVVRKQPKGHGQTKQVEGNFQAGDTVVVIDDVITTGESTIKAITAVREAGGTVAFAAVLVDRQGTGRANIEAAGVAVVSAFTKDELLAR